MKALDEHFLMVVFTLLLNRVHVFADSMFRCHRNLAVKGLNIFFPAQHTSNVSATPDGLSL